MNKKLLSIFIFIGCYCSYSQNVDSLGFNKGYQGPLNQYQRYLLFDSHIGNRNSSTRFFAAAVDSDKIIIAEDQNDLSNARLYNLKGRLLDTIKFDGRELRRIDYSPRYHALMLLPDDEKSILLIDVFSGKQSLTEYTPERWYYAKDSAFENFFTGFRDNVLTYSFNNHIDRTSRFNYNYQLSLLADGSIIQFWPYMVAYRRAPSLFVDRQWSFIEENNPSVILDAKDSFLVYTDNCYSMTVHTPGHQEHYEISGIASDFCTHTRYYPFKEGIFIEVSSQDSDKVAVYMWQRR